MKKFLSLALALFVTSSLYAVPPQEKGDAPGHMFGHHQKFEQNLEKIAKELNITDEQKAQMNEMMKVDMERKGELRKQVKEKMDAVTDELMKENVDMNAINAIAADIQQLSAEISRINVESKVKVRSILSYEQYTKMEQSRKEMMEKFNKEFKDEAKKAFADKAKDKKDKQDKKDKKAKK
ncbi:MAG: periplasmic heavy metal sensor [Elusimicrobia bacterium]|nr:periplasmic heavy metal sensor [Elusimicrobiota bacterium]